MHLPHRHLLLRISAAGSDNGLQLTSLVVLETAALVSRPTFCGLGLAIAGLDYPPTLQLTGYGS